MKGTNKLLKALVSVIMLMVMVVGVLPHTTVYAASKKTKVSTNAGTFEDPIKIGTSYKMSGTVDFLDDKLKGTYYFTVNSAKKLSAKQLKKYEYSNADTTKYDYILMNVTEQVKNGKMIKKNGDGVLRATMFAYGVYDLWGAVDKRDTYSVIGCDDYSFDSSIRDQIEEIMGLDTIKAGKSVNYKISGDVMICVPKGSGLKGYFILQDPFISDYETSKIHFALK